MFAQLLMFIRSLLFAVGFYGVTIIYSTCCIIVSPVLSFRQRFRLITSINFFYMFWLRVTCGVKIKFEGKENLPKEGAYVVVANHQSEWETLFLQTVIRPQSTVLKQELLKMPFFGWALAMLKPIALDRENKRGALKQLLKEGKQRLVEEQIPLLIFPQGTRLPVTQFGQFNKGAAMLALSSKVPVVPVAHNAGYFWPAKGFLKHPGTITLRVGSPMVTNDRTVEEIREFYAGWIAVEMEKLDVDAKAQLSR
ncbi:MAG: lysophospholipid acyltransferase family protein [Pontibacterium sp.]